MLAARGCREEWRLWSFKDNTIRLQSPGPPSARVPVSFLFAVSRLAAELSAVKGRSWPPGGDQAAAGRS